MRPIYIQTHYALNKYAINWNCLDGGYFKIQCAKRVILNTSSIFHCGATFSSVIVLRLEFRYVLC